MSEVVRLAALVRDSRGVAHKRDIAPVVARLGIGGGDAIAVGDDAAVISDGDDFLLLAIEGFVADFVAADPWFAGYCGVMVNLSDIAAMGGRAIAVVDALWSDGEAGAAPILAGLREAASRYGVPIVGGHSNLRSPDGQLAVAVLGRADRPIRGDGARPGNALIVVTDLRGAFRGGAPWWDASTSAEPARLRGDLAVLPTIADLVTAGKDISMAGVVGTAMMLAEASAVGLTIDLDLLPIPAHVSIERWLTAFPSFGFVLAAAPDMAGAVVACFHDRDVAAAVVGTVDAGRSVFIYHSGKRAQVWDFAEPLTGCTRMPPKEMLDA